MMRKIKVRVTEFVDKRFALVVAVIAFVLMSVVASAMQGTNQGAQPATAATATPTATAAAQKQSSQSSGSAQAQAAPLPPQDKDAPRPKDTQAAATPIPLNINKAVLPSVPALPVKELPDACVPIDPAEVTPDTAKRLFDPSAVPTVPVSSC